MYNWNNRLPYVKVQLESWLKWLFSGWGLDVDGPHGSWCQRSTKNTTYMAFGYYASLYSWQNKKNKNHICDLFISQFELLYWNCKFTSCNSYFIRIVRYYKFIIARKRKSDIKSLLPYSLYIPWQKYVFIGSTLRGKTNKYKKCTVQRTLLSLTSSYILFFFLSLILCCSASPKPKSRIFLVLFTNA